MLVINDLHIGALRNAGTTIPSALALRNFGLSKLSEMLDEVNEDLVILGDLFDTYSIPMVDLLSVYRQLAGWLEKGHRLTLVPGNHDLSKDSSRLSSFEFLSGLLSELPNVHYLVGGGWVDEAAGVYAISHVANQDLLNLELSKVPKCKVLLLHANYHNGFAVDSDHSLNVSQEQAEACPAETLFFAHEHYHRKALADRVWVAGNQFPMSVSDCLDGQHKFMHKLYADGSVERIRTWTKDDYAEVDWRNPQQTDARFVRFVGECKPEESADMAGVIVAYRKASDAFIVTNAVKVTTGEEDAALALGSLEAITNFNVMEALRDYLTEEEFKILESLDA